jgi:hypothetical protein
MLSAWSGEVTVAVGDSEGHSETARHRGQSSGRRGRDQDDDLSARPNMAGVVTPKRHAADGSTAGTERAEKARPYRRAFC